MITPPPARPAATITNIAASASLTTRGQGGYDDDINKTTKGLIIMTRTHIITGDGTHYEEVGATKARNRKIFRRVIGIAATLATAIFLSAVIIGFSQAATPTALPKPLAGALTACKGVDARWQGYCIGLYLRPAHKDANTFTPAGPALVKECLDQYRGQELASCLTQPTD